MATTHPTAVRNAIADLVVDRADAGSDNGVLVIGTSSLSGSTGVLGTLDLDDPAFGNASDGSASALNGPWEVEATAAGTAAVCEVRDSDGNVCFRGSVGTSGADCNLSSVTIALGDLIRISSLSYTAPS